MKIKLIAYSQPVEGVVEDLENVQDLIAFCAKVSNPQLQNDFTNAEKLLNYLAKHKHWSPFEMATATMEITTTRDIARQMLRHGSFKFQEFSQRYADVTLLDDSFVIREARLQDNKNRQNSLPNDDVELEAWWDAQQKFIIESVSRIYKEALEKGIAKEQARAILPEGNTVSRLYMQGSIRSWIHYVSLRSGNGTQKEHIEVAVACAEAITKIFPLIDEYVE